MNYIYAWILGLIRGLGEFLPISHTGHRQILNKIVSLPRQLAEAPGLEAVLDLAALLAVVLLFHKTLWKMLCGFCAMIAGLFSGSFRWSKASRYQMMAVYVLVATLPYLVVTWAAEHFGFAARWSNNLLLAGIMLLVTGALLLLGNISYCHNWTAQDMKAGQALKLGLFQAVALIPGLSRGGTTLAMGMNMGFHRNDALEFSFMLSVPALLLSAGTKAGGLAQIPASRLLVYGVAAVGALLSALGAILLIKWLVKKDRLDWVIYYCALAGIAAIILNFAL